MANKVAPSPVFPPAPANDNPRGLSAWARALGQALQRFANEVASRANASYTIDGAERITGPAMPPFYGVATLPPASIRPHSIVIVTDDVGGETIAFSDGTNWRRAQDRAIVSLT